MPRPNHQYLNQGRVMNYETKAVEVTFEDGTKGEMELQFPIKEKSKVCIVGCASSKDIVPWGDKDTEFWGVNNLYGIELEGAHYDRWFEIHNIWSTPGTDNLIRRGSADFRGQPVLEYLQGLAKLDICIYMQKHWPELIPKSVPLPIEDMVQWFLSKGLPLDQCRYITNTISYEIALAIYLGFKEIQVWGVDMAVGTEYEHQRPSCEFWLGVARGMGINVVIPAQADLLKTRFVYGFEEKQHDLWRDKVEKVRVDMKLKRLRLQQRHAQDEQAIQQYIGGEQVAQELNKLWVNEHSDDLMFTKRGC